MKINIRDGHTLNINKPVKVHRNLHLPGVTYAIVQNGNVVAYATELALILCACYVNTKAVARIKEKKVREVHAWIAGILTDEVRPTSRKLRYNPYTHPFFYDEATGAKIDKAPYMLFNEKGVHL